MTRPKIFLQCFALEQREYKAKHCRNVLGARTRLRTKKLDRKSVLKSPLDYFLTIATTAVPTKSIMFNKKEKWVNV